MNRRVTGLGTLAAVLSTVGMTGVLFGGTVAPGVPSSPSRGVSVEASADTVSFAGDVLPILELRCIRCHGGEDEGEIRIEASLSLLSHEGVMAGSEFGSVVEPGDAEGSYLIEMIVTGDMPDEGDPVPDEELQILRAWIDAGAPDN